MSLIKNKTVTVFIPAWNEGNKLRQAVKGALDAIKSVEPLDYELLVLDAYSSDDTGEIADQLSKENDKIKVIHRDKWFGLGANYMEGVRQASMEYFVMFPGDNENSWISLAESLEKIGSADIIIPYTINPEARTIFRRVLSRCFVLFLNICFNIKLKYYNGNAVYKSDILKNMRVKSEDFAYNAEILIKLLKSGYSYVEIGIKIQPTKKTAIFSVKNILGVIKSILLLYIDINIIHKLRLDQKGSLSNFKEINK